MKNKNFFENNRLEAYALLFQAIVLLMIFSNFPILKEALSISFLLFIPGLLFLRLLNIKAAGLIENLLYSLGLSISMLMFMGFALNSILPILGIENPITSLNIIISTNIIVLLLVILNLKIKKEKIIINKEGIFSQYSILFSTLPFISIIGTYAMNNYQNNIILLSLICIICASILIIGFKKNVPSNIYPIAIFSISLSLLFHRSLISSFLNGWDINSEFYYANLVIKNFYWNSALTYNYNSMLSITMLAPIYSIFSGIDLYWIFKIIYPLIFAFVPLGLFKIFETQTNNKIAFFSVLFIISISSFFGEFTALGKQIIGELFLILLLLIIIKKEYHMKNSILLVIFGISMIVSHYATSYIFLLIIGTAMIIINITKKLNLLHIFKENYSPKVAISTTFVVLLFVVSFTWYMYLSSSSVYVTIIKIGSQITGSIFTELLNPQYVEGIRVAKTELSPIHSLAKYLHFITQISIFIGLFVVFKKKLFDFSQEYLALSIVSIFILIMTLVIPYFSNTIGISRMYHLNIIFLAPFCIIGFIYVFKLIYSRLFNWDLKKYSKAYKYIAIFFVVFLLFNTDFIYQITGDQSTSISLNSTLDYPTFNEKEFEGAIWLINNKNKSNIYSDNYRSLLITNYDINSKTIPHYFKGLPAGNYLFLGETNINGLIRRVESGPARTLKADYISTNQLTENKSEIYDNGGSQIFLTFSN